MQQNTNTTTSTMPEPPYGYMLDEDGRIVTNPAQTGLPPITTSVPQPYQPSNSYQSAYSRAMDNFTAEDLDRRCDEMHWANELYRRTHG